jgi:hypothetical protein
MMHYSDALILIVNIKRQNLPYNRTCRQREKVEGVEV